MKEHWQNEKKEKCMKCQYFIFQKRVYGAMLLTSTDLILYGCVFLLRSFGKTMKCPLNVTIW